MTSTTATSPTASSPPPRPARTATTTALNPADVPVTNTDDDAAGITVTPTSGLTTTEAGGTATFTVVLDAQPTADVTVTSEPRHDRRHGPARVADLHERQLEHGADRHRDRRQR